MKRFLLFSFIVLLALSSCNQPYTLTPTSASTPTSRPTETPIPPTPTTAPTSTSTPTSTPVAVVELQRGINFGNMLEAPHEGDWGLTVQEGYFDLVKEAGFDFVRLPINWSGHTDKAAPYTIDPAFITRIDQVVGWAQQRNLGIILDFHNYDEMMSDPQNNENRFLEIWGQLADHYRDYPANVLFELLNEPNTGLDAALWNRYAAEALAAIRKTNPTRDVIIGSVQWNAYEWVTTLDIPNDPYIIVTFHYYEPFQFTHQGAEWVAGSNRWLGATWDGTDEQKAEIVNNFDAVADWSKRHNNIRILLGEFGAYSKAPQDSRVRWTTYVREQAEAHGFVWAYWEFGSGFGVYDPASKSWRDDLLKALIP